jgi:CYTH domain-containing protein
MVNIYKQVRADHVPSILIVILFAGAPMKNARRFLVSPCIARLISRERGVDRQVVEGYLSSQPGKDQLVRLEADQAHFVLSGQDPEGNLVEKLAPLPREHAEALFSLCIGQISYDRLHLPPQSDLSHTIQLDRVVYPSSFDLITVEFDDSQKAETFEIPTWFGPEVTTEFTFEWRYIALNGFQSNLEVPLASQQVEAVLDMLDQSRAATKESNISAADDVIVALSRSLETSGLLKAAKETNPPPELEPLPEELREPVKRTAQ